MRDIPVDLIFCFVALLLVAAFAAIIFRKIRFPYTIGLVLLGMGLYGLGVATGTEQTGTGLLPRFFNALPDFSVLQRIHLTPNFILYILLPTLVFDAALNMDSRLLFKNIIPILTMAVPGIIVAIAITGGLMYWLTPLDLNSALLFGALISTTDPVAVIALFKEIGAPERLNMLVDGESLFNDATAIVAFDIIKGIAIVAAAAGTVAPTWTLSVAGTALGQFLFVFLGGALLGAFVGWLMIQVIRLANKDPLLEIAFSTVVAYAAFIMANDYLGLSGVMAAVGAGMVINYYSTTRISAATQQYMRQFWGYASFLANSFIFLLLGLTEIFLIKETGRLYVIIGAIVAAILSVLIARIVIVVGGCSLYNLFTKPQNKIDGRNQAVMIWGGLRGALPIALAVSLPADFPGRDFILQYTIAIVLFSLLIQGTTIKKLMSWLKLNQPSLRERISSLNAIDAAVSRSKTMLDELVPQLKRTPQNELDQIRSAMQSIQQDATDGLRSIFQETDALDSDRATALWLQANEHENRVYSALFADGFINEIAFQQLRYYADSRRTLILSGKHPTTAALSLPFRDRLRLSNTAALKQMFPKWTLTKRRIFEDFSVEFTVHIAIRQAFEQALANKDRFAALCRATPGAISDFAATYQSGIEHINRGIDALAERAPKDFTTMQELLIRRLLFRNQVHTLEEMKDLALLNESDAIHIAEQFEQAMCKTTKA